MEKLKIDIFLNTIAFLGHLWVWKFHWGLSLYYTSAKGLGGWVWKIVILSNVQFYVFADMGGSEKVQKYAEIVERWSISKSDNQLLKEFSNIFFLKTAAVILYMVRQFLWLTKWFSYCLKIDKQWSCTILKNKWEVFWVFMCYSRDVVFCYFSTK